MKRVEYWIVLLKVKELLLARPNKKRFRKKIPRIFGHLIENPRAKLYESILQNSFSVIRLTFPRVNVIFKARSPRIFNKSIPHQFVKHNIFKTLSLLNR